MKKMSYMNTMEYYSALERKETLAHAVAWMNLEDTMLTETIQTEKNTHDMIPLT